MLFGVDDFNRIFGLWRLCSLGSALWFVEHGRDFTHRLAAHTHGKVVLPQGLCGVRALYLAHIFRRAFSHHQTTAIASFGAQINQPVARANHIQVVLDDDQRVTRLQQLAQCAH